MNRSDSIKEIATALAKAQGELENPAFDTQNPFFKSRYASLAAVRNAVTPVFAKHGLSVVQFLRSTDKGAECETMLMHNSGEWLADTLTMPIAKHDAQGYGSAATYARRYSLMAVSGVVGDEDDDANAASDTKAKKSKSAFVAPESAPDETRAMTLERLCAEAGANVADLLAKAEVAHADAMSDADWSSAVRYLKKKASAKPAQAAI